MTTTNRFQQLWNRCFDQNDGADQKKCLEQMEKYLTLMLQSLLQVVPKHLLTRYFRALGYIHPHQFEGLKPFWLKTRFHHLSFFEFIGAISSKYFSLQGNESNIPPERKAKLPSRSSSKVPNGNGYVFRKAIIFGNSSFYMFYAVP